MSRRFAVSTRIFLSETSLGRRTKEYDLPDRQSTGACDRAVDSHVVLVRTNDRLYQFWHRSCGGGIEVHYRAGNVAHRDGGGR